MKPVKDEIHTYIGSTFLLRDIRKDISDGLFDEVVDSFNETRLIVSVYYSFAVDGRGVLNKLIHHMKGIPK